MHLLDIDQYLQMDTTGYRVLISVLAIIVSLIILNKVNKTKLNHFISDKVKFLASGIFLSGIILYMIGFWDEGSKGNILTLFFRASLSSLEMFVSHSDLIEVRHSMHENALYMFVFALVHFLAVLLSAILIIPLIAYIWHSKSVLRKLRTPRLFIFWGESTSSFMLAEDIIRTQKDNNYRILFLETPSDGKSSDSSIHFTHLFSGSLVKNERMERIANLRALLLSSKVSILKRDNEHSLKDLLEDAGLSFLYKCLLKDSVKDIKIFFLSRDQEANRKNAAALISTTEPQDSPMLRKKIEVYCHSFYNDLCVVYSYGALYMRSLGKNNVSLSIVDTSRLSIVELKNNPIYHPVNYVNPDTTTAMAQSPFTALIVGFDESGEEALKFVYEFGCFVGADGKKNPLKCYVLCANAEGTKNRYYLAHPAFANNPEVEFISFSKNSKEFYEWEIKVLNDLNFVFVNTGDDMKNLSMATDILHLAHRNRTTDPHYFKIFIRSYDIKYYHELCDMASYYNNTNPEWGENVVVFGCKRDLFTYKSVVDQQAVMDSIAFYNVFAQMTGREDWMTRYKNLSRTYAQHQELAFCLNQDMSNYWHAKTKATLAGVKNPSEKDRFDKLLQCVATRPDMTHYAEELAQCKTPEEHNAVVRKYCTYQGTDEQRKILFNLAKTEHMRWCALMELMGYTPYYDDIQDGDPNLKDTVQKKHSCMVSIETMQSVSSLSETIPYDYAVVDICLRMAAGLIHV